MHAIFGPSVEDRWVGAYRRAAAMVDGWLTSIARRAKDRTGQRAQPRMEAAKPVRGVQQSEPHPRSASGHYRTMDEARDALLALGFDIAQLAPQGWSALIMPHNRPSGTNSARLKPGHRKLTESAPGGIPA
jgi:hypothetical protein